MAELLLFVKRNEAKYDDGDILVAVNNKKILHVHAQHICHEKLVSRNADGYIPLASLPDVYASRLSSSRLEVVSKTEIHQIESGTEKVLEVFTNKGTGNYISPSGKNIYLPLFLKNRQKITFGTKGHERWYKQSNKLTDALISAIWDDIESHSAERRTNYTKWPWSVQEKMAFCPLQLNTDLVDEECETYILPEIDDTVPENTVILQKRMYKIDYRTDLGLPENKISDIIDPGKESIIDIAFAKEVIKLKESRTHDIEDASQMLGTGVIVDKFTYKDISRKL